MVKNRPNTLGNVWMQRESERGLEYLSDQYFGRVMGYEEIEHKTLACPDIRDCTCHSCDRFGR